MNKKNKKRVPVRTATVDEDDTLRLAHLLKAIQRRASVEWAHALTARAFAFNGHTVEVRRCTKVPS